MIGIFIFKEFLLPPDSAGSRLLSYPNERRIVTWSDIEWLKSSTRLPIILKGILTPEDAILAVEHGVRGIIVSNHGGRQLDTVPATVTQNLSYGSLSIWLIHLEVISE